MKKTLLYDALTLGSFATLGDAWVSGHHSGDTTADRTDHCVF